MTEIKERRVIDDIVLVEHPELIKVKTIKKVYLEQVQKLDKDGDPWRDCNLKIVGKADYEILLERVDGRLIKAHRIDFVALITQKYMSKGLDYKEAVTKAQEEIESLPQIFKD